MKKKKDISPGMSKLLKKIKKRVDAAKEVEKRGGNKYEQLEARLLDEDTEKLGQDIVIYAIQILDNYKDAESFYHGYIKNIAENPDKYPKEAKGRPKYYAGYDIKVALNMHFTSSRTHELWDKVIARGVFTKEKD